MQVFEFRETPEPMIIMTYYPAGNMLDAGVIDDEKYVSALGQVLDGLSHLHAQGVAHRDLKSENFLVENQPLFKVIITDFGLAKVVNNTTLLTTFCGTLKYLAPEVFPGLSEGHGPPVDVWSLGVLALEWIYGIPQPSDSPKPRRNGKDVPSGEWYLWIQLWSDKLLDKLDNEENGQVVEILLHKIDVEARRRWQASKCLSRGFRNGLFKRRLADGLVVCSLESDELTEPFEGANEGAKTPRATTPLAARDPEAAIVSKSVRGVPVDMLGASIDSCNYTHPR